MSDTHRTEYVVEFDPSHPDADPETGMREWSSAELAARDERLNAAHPDSSTVGGASE